jgi:hypothetical protein
VPSNCVPNSSPSASIQHILKDGQYPCARCSLGKCRDFFGAVLGMTMHEAPGREPASSPSEHSQQSQLAPHQPQAVDSSAAHHQINPLFTLAPHAPGSTAGLNGLSYIGLEAANRGPREVQDACANQPCVKFPDASPSTQSAASKLLALADAAEAAEAQDAAVLVSKPTLGVCSRSRPCKIPTSLCLTCHASALLH